MYTVILLCKRMPEKKHVHKSSVYSAQEKLNITEKEFIQACYNCNIRY